MQRTNGRTTGPRAYAALALMRFGGPACIGDAGDELVGRILPVDLEEELARSLALGHGYVPHAFEAITAAGTDPAARAGGSALREVDPAALDRGLSRLVEDLRSGRRLEQHGHLLQLTELDCGLRLVIGDEERDSSHTA